MDIFVVMGLFAIPLILAFDLGRKWERMNWEDDEEISVICDGGNPGA